MRACCASLAICVTLAAALASAPARAGTPAKVKLVKKATWDLTIKTAPRGWERNYDLGKGVVRRMRELFPKERGKFFALARGIGLDQHGDDLFKFWIVKLALKEKPPAEHLVYLKLALADLRGRYVSPGPALELARGVDLDKLDEKTRKYFKGRMAFWKEWEYDILAIGRSYEAERLMGEADEFADPKRKEYKQAAARLIKVVLKHGNGYYPLKSGAILGTGFHARNRLAGMVLKHAREVAEAAEEVSPGLGARAGAGDRTALELLARVYPYTRSGWAALLRLGEADLDAARPRLAALRFSRCLALAAGGRSKAEALWRLAAARSTAGDRPGADAALEKLAALKGAKARVGGQDVPAAEAAALVRKEMALPAAVKTAPLIARPGATLAPRVVFTSRPSLFDLRNRCTLWPRFWRRPESLPAVSGDRVFFHGSSSVWALDWRRGKLLWHYRTPGAILELHHRGRSFSNQINEARQTGRGYRVGVSGEYLSARFRRPEHHLSYELRGLAATDGRLLWSTADKAELRGLSYASDPVGAYDRFYVLAFSPIHISGAFVVCLDPRTGRIIWKSQVASGIDSWGSDIGNFFSAHGGITVADGRVYLSSDRGSLLALDALDGSLRWVSSCDRIFERGDWAGIRTHTTKADRSVMVERSHTAPVMGTGAVYFLAKDHPGIFAVNASTGRKLFVQLPRTAVEVLGESGGVVVAAGRRGLFGMKAGNGDVVWEHGLPLAGNVPWRSGFLRGGKVYWPAGQDVLILSAADGKQLGRAMVKGSALLVTLRPLPSGEIAAFSSSGAVDQFAVLAADVKTAARLVAETPGAVTDRDSLTVRIPDAAEVGAAPAKPTPSAPLPPVELLWMARFSPEQIFTGRYPVKVIDSPPRMLVAAGTELRCYRFDARGALLWRAPTPPTPQEIQLWSGGRVCLRWSHGIEVYDLATGARKFGWSSQGNIGRGQATGGMWGAAEVAEDIALVWTRVAFQAVRMPGGEKLWVKGIVNNAYGLHASLTPWGALTHVRQDRSYGGRSYLDLYDPATGKRRWNKKLDKGSYARLEGRRVWTWVPGMAKVGLVEAGKDGVREVWSRRVPGGGDRVIFDGDRVLVVKSGRGVTAFNKMTGKDAMPAAKLTGGSFAAGPVYTYRARGRGYGRQVVRTLDRGTGKQLWEWSTGGGGPPQATTSQVLVPGGMPIYTFFRRYYRHPSPAGMGSLYSLDLKSGRALGAFAIPGRDLDSSRLRAFQPNIVERNNMLLLRTESGPAVMGAASLGSRTQLRKEVALLEKGDRGLAGERRLAMLRERLMRYAPPTLGAERISRPPHLDGEFDDWAGARWRSLTGARNWAPVPGGALAAADKKWGGAKDCSARFAVRHDGSTLYFAVEVRDDDFSPPTGSSFLTPGDCLEVGLSFGAVRPDALTIDGDRYYPDVKVRFALKKSGPGVQRLWYGDGSEAAVSARPGLLRYEVAIPFKRGRLRMIRSDALGFALRVFDADRGQPKGALSWAGGLAEPGSAARFGSVVLAPLSERELADSRRLADLLPDSALAWDLLRKMARTHLARGDAAAAGKELGDFLRRHPQSYHASKCLVWSAHLARLAGGAKPGAVPKLADLEAEEARMRVFARVKVPEGRRPRNLGFKVQIKGRRWQSSYWRGVYWGQRREFLAGGLLYAGPLPAGEDLELGVPAELLGLANKTAMAVQFLQHDGAAWWGDFGLVDAAGKRRIWVPAGAECKVRHSNFTKGKAPDGSAAHFPTSLGLGWSAHTFVPPRRGRRGSVLADSDLANANLKLEAAGGKLPREKCLAAAQLMPGNRLAGDLLTAVGDKAEIAKFVRKHPGSPVVPGLLWWLAYQGRDGALAGKLIAEAGVSREVGRAHYARLAAGIPAWQVVGPFSNEADVALRRTYPPEKLPSLKAKYRIGEEQVGWQPVKVDRGGYVNIGAALKGSDYQAAYAVCWVHSAKRRRAWVYLSTGNVISMWNGDERIMENVDAGGGSRRRRYRRTLAPVPITLQPGANRILVKNCTRWGYWGFKMYLGRADGAPLAGLKFSTEEPPRPAASP